MEEGFILVLSGGGVRGFAHIGVLKALEELGLEPRMVIGTSAGAVVAAYWVGLYSRSNDATCRITK
ncbi:hypothetical protein FK509_27010 [Klebsiella pneumoniae]|nr:hypothetical protein [Klebsiella pneumoniae]